MKIKELMGQAANGAVGTASSTYSASYPASATINGDRRGLNWNNGGGWNDGTVSAYPDWLQIDFNGSKTIDEIDVFSVQDDPANPAEPTETMTFTAYGITTFDVQYWNGSSWITVPGGSVAGNNKVWRKFTFAAITTSKIRVVVNNALATYSRIVEVEALGTAAVPPTNVALSANGAVASASSVYSSGYSAAGANNGERKGAMWGSGAGWNDATQGAFPDWLQVDFNGSKTIDEIDVFSVQDNYGNPVEPTEAMTFSLYGLTTFEAQYWNGSSWTTVPGGSISGNNKVWRKITFSPITTSKIRVHISAAADGYSRITEVEAWGGGSANVNWLVADHLGTPRMIFDRTGSLANVKRHDYLPFGEELFAGTGGRTTQNGYSGDSIRQKFTGYERDNETGLDYAQARYYANIQGRFSSVDPLMTSARGTNPQSWNRYSYVLNKPLITIDPSGLAARSASGGCAAEFSNCNNEDPRSRVERDYEARLEHQYNAIAATRAAREGDWDTYYDIMDEDNTLQDVRSSVDFTTVRVVSPLNTQSPNGQTHEVTGFGHVQAVTLDLSEELGTDGKKVPDFTIKVNFILPEDYESIDYKKSAVSAPKDNRWEIMNNPEPKMTGRKGSATVQLKQRSDEANRQYITIHIEGTRQRGQPFVGDLRIRIVTAPLDLPKDQRDQP